MFWANSRYCIGKLVKDLATFTLIWGMVRRYSCNVDGPQVLGLRKMNFEGHRALMEMVLKY